MREWLISLLRRLGFVPARELEDALGLVSRQRAGMRVLAGEVAAQHAEIGRMAARYSGTVDAANAALRECSERSRVLA